jgi:hypothetical protein
MLHGATLGMRLKSVKNETQKLFEDDLFCSRCQRYLRRAETCRNMAPDVRNSDKKR